jgi:CRISPR-associated endonuclease Cas1 subtype II
MIVRGETEQHIHLSEIGTLIIESTAVAFTAALVAELVKQNINIILCDEKHQPHSGIMPFCGNYLSSKNIKKQCGWTDARKGEIWRKIVYQKIFWQARVLSKYECAEAAEKLQGYLSDLAFNDGTNREGHAAKVHFNALFGQSFSRGGGGEINAALNYGYAVLLSAVAREIVAAGYMTQLGIWHSNEFNQYNMASDLMEPFRPMVDDYVLGITELNDFKQRMPAIMLSKLSIKGQTHFLDSAIKLFARSVFKFMNGESDEIAEIADYTLGNYEL